MPASPTFTTVYWLEHNFLPPPDHPAWAFLAIITTAPTGFLQRIFQTVFLFLDFWKQIIFCIETWLSSGSGLWLTSFTGMDFSLSHRVSDRWHFLKRISQPFSSSFSSHLKVALKIEVALYIHNTVRKCPSFSGHLKMLWCWWVDRQ